MRLRSNRSGRTAHRTGRLLALALTIFAAGATDPLPARAGWIHPELERRLAALRPAAGQTEAISDRWVVWITLRDAAADVGPWFAAHPECEAIGRLGPAIEARVPASRIRELANQAGVRAVGLPPRPVPLTRSEGIDGMRAPEYWSRFGTGRGVRLGILDVGFTGYERLLGSELPLRTKARSFYYLSSEVTDIGGEGETHGTACAEIAHDVAPEAELYLANAGSPVELQMAVDWMVDSGVEVISHSVGWPVGIGDGTGPLDDIVASVTSRGVIWVNAAGNFAESNWGGIYRDDDSDRVTEVGTAGEESLYLPTMSAGEQMSTWLLWDSWPTSPDLSFELDLLDADGTILTSSQEDWSDWPYAFRPITYRAPAIKEGLRLRVRSVHGEPAGRRLRVIRLDANLQPESRVGAGSIAVPADSPDAIAVGAYAWSNLLYEPYSSYGPNLAGLPKPEVLGPDGVHTTTTDEGGTPFYGTSAACPHMAGAVALLLSAGVRGGLFDGRFDRDTILQLLRREATAITPPYPDGAIGWGRVRLPIEPLAEKSLGPRLIVSGYENGKGPVLRLLRAPDDAGVIRLYDVLGRSRGTIGATRDGDDRAYDPADLGPDLVRGRYWAREARSGERVAFYWPGGGR